MTTPVTAATLLKEVFHTDLKNSVKEPGEGKEVVVKSGGKVSTLSRKKMLEGNFSEFQKLTSMQNRTITSIMNAASIISGSQTMEGGDNKLTEKIIKRFKKFKEKSKDLNEKQFARDLFLYASELQNEFYDRRWQIDKQTGFSDSWAINAIANKLSTQELDKRGWISMIQSNYKKLQGVNSTIQDIHRYGLNNRYHLFLGEGKEFPLPEYDGKNISVYVDSLLKTFMVNLNMLGDTSEPELSEHGVKIASQFQSYVRDEINKADKISGDEKKKSRTTSMIPQSEVDEAGEDQVRDALCNLIRDLSEGKFGPDEKGQILDKKLGFLLFGMNQNWVVGPGIQLGRIAKECSIQGRFRETLMSAAAKIDEHTTINLVIDPAGMLAIEARGLHTNLDHATDKAPQDYIAEINTFIEFKPDAPPDVAFSIKMSVPENDAKLDEEHKSIELKNREIKRMVDLLNRMGFNVKIATIPS